MDLTELKKLIGKSTAVIVMENGEPSYVVLNYKNYKDLIFSGEEIAIKNNSGTKSNINEIEAGNGEIPSSGQASNENELGILERINKDILALKSEIEKEEKVLVE